MAKREKKMEEDKNLNAWMATYSDLVTLLLCFFVLLFATSDVNSEKFKQIAESFSKKLSIMPGQNSDMLDALGNGIVAMPQVKGESDKEFEEQGKEELEEMAKNFENYFEENGLKDEIQVEKSDRYITLNFKDGILFDVGKADIKSEAIKVLSMVSDEIAKYPDNHIKIEGHTDNMPINTVRFPNNWYLSASRAISVATYFIDTKNFEPNRISTEGYGEYRPKAPNDTPENRSKNRRVEIKIISKYYDYDL